MPDYRDDTNPLYQPAAEQPEEWDEEERKMLAQDFGVINCIYEKIRSTLDDNSKREIDRYIQRWGI